MGGEEEKILRVGYQMLLNKRIHRAGKTSTPASLLSSLPSPSPPPSILQGTAVLLVSSTPGSCQPIMACSGLAFLPSQTSTCVCLCVRLRACE